mgnify:CR=1 FL=1
MICGMFCFRRSSARFVEKNSPRNVLPIIPTCPTSRGSSVLTPWPRALLLVLDGFGGRKRPWICRGQSTHTCRTRPHSRSRVDRRLSADAAPIRQPVFVFVMASGGVSIRPDEALQQDRIMRDSDGELADQYQRTGSIDSGDRWWWD